MKPTRKPLRRRPEAASAPPAPRVVYTQAPLMLATLLGRGAGGWRVRLGDVERELPVDAALDVALLEEALLSGARVVVDSSGDPVIAGLLTTGRSLAISREGSIDAQVTDFRLTSSRGLLLRTSEAFIQLKAAELELYANRVVSRAREVAKIMGRLIKLN